VRWLGWLMIAALAAAAALAPRLVRRQICFVASVFDCVARRRAAAIVTCAVLATAGSIAVSLHRWPEPREHDELSYLLAADTFAHGRLANPTHPMWRHFETFHVLQQPTYASKFPPAQGLFLALGQIAFGHPIAGVWLSGGLMAAAICWMLYGFLPGRWALAGGLLGAAQFGVATYWTQSYWGGAIAAAGGALVIGALPRIVRSAQARDGLIFGCGIVLLANSRPFEGLVLAIGVAGVLAARIVRPKGGLTRRALARALVPTVAALIAGGLWTIAYDFAVTGAPFRLPYRAYQDAYPFSPLFLWLPVEPAPEYRHEVIRRMSDALFETYRVQHTVAGFLRENWEKMLAYWRFFVGPHLSIALAAAPFAFRRRGMRFALAILGMMVLALLGETYYMHHYFAPMTAALVLVLTGGLRVLATWRPRGAPIGAAVACAIGLCVLVSAFEQARRPHPAPAEWRRTAVLAELEQAGGRHLVVVRYGPHHVPNFEWVYNQADIDGSSVVWAHDLGETENRRLLEYFRGRRVSLLEVGFDGGAPVPRPYPE
jgi:hypothetical protein